MRPSPLQQRPRTRLRLVRAIDERNDARRRTHARRWAWASAQRLVELRWVQSRNFALRLFACFVTFVSLLGLAGWLEVG